jgi:phage tail protein X
MTYDQAASVTTQDGDVLDALVAAHYGAALPLAGALDLVLSANPGLAGGPRVMARGVTIVLPAIVRPVAGSGYGRTGVIRLWGET